MRPRRRRLYQTSTRATRAARDSVPSAQVSVSLGTATPRPLAQTTTAMKSHPRSDTHTSGNDDGDAGWDKRKSCQYTTGPHTPDAVNSTKMRGEQRERRVIALASGWNMNRRYATGPTGPNPTAQTPYDAAKTRRGSGRASTKDPGLPSTPSRAEALP
ncbi:hypothetical protein D9611_010839 [Ephemerocybe angulata]|uniref:Uncharacterized protein n=1 Tax=Ephemerocybe angulata TaxID=980116 RepID=A0A8H5C5N6_9AGAR|nr:hypothetical protein D9611_010839 [Tulosesus angulatus]